MLKYNVKMLFQYCGGLALEIWSIISFSWKNHINSLKTNNDNKHLKNLIVKSL